MKAKRSEHFQMTIVNDIHEIRHFMSKIMNVNCG